MPKIAPSNPLLLKGDREALLQSYKLAKNTYFALLRATDINASRGCFLVFLAFLHFLKSAHLAPSHINGFEGAVFGNSPV